MIVFIELHNYLNQAVQVNVEQVTYMETLRLGQCRTRLRFAGGVESSFLDVVETLEDIAGRLREAARK